MEPSDFLPYLNKTAQKYLEKVQKEVKYCTNCQPNDGDSYIWILGDQTTLEDIFDEFGVPERYRDIIADYIVCDNCGTTDFDRYSDVGKEDRYSIQTQVKIKNVEKKYGRQIDKLQKFLNEYPTLALCTPMGKKIYKEIIEGKILPITIEGKFFRGRPVITNKVYGLEDMTAPPKGCAKDGRYHHSGQSVLYMASSKDTAIAEVLDNYFEAGLVWIQEYNVSKIENILDLRNEWNSIVMADSTILVGILSSRLIDQKVDDRKSNWKPEYFVTRFIADCARLAGYNGIMYSSTRTIGNDIVIFNPDTECVKPVGEPIIFIHKPRLKQISDYPEF
jgi:hypothetical protein